MSKLIKFETYVGFKRISKNLGLSIFKDFFIYTDSIGTVTNVLYRNKPYGCNDVENPLKERIIKEYEVMVEEEFKYYRKA